MIITDQTATDLAHLQRAIDASIFHAESFARALDLAHAALWGLPEERIVSALNQIGAGAMIKIFGDHGIAAASLNAMLEMAGSPVRAAVALPRQVLVDDAGVVSLAPFNEQFDSLLE